MALEVLKVLLCLTLHFGNNTALGCMEIFKIKTAMQIKDLQISNSVPEELERYLRETKKNPHNFDFAFYEQTLFSCD